MIGITLYGLIAFRLEVILAKAQVRVVSDRRQITKKKPLKEVIKLFAPLILILGIAVGIIYLCIAYPPYRNNVFMMSLGLWLIVLDLNLAALFATYIAKGILRSSITGLRLKVIRDVKLITTMAHIFTAINIVVVGGLVLVTYLIYLRAAASGLTKIPTPLTTQQVILILLLLVMLLPLAYVVKRETEKVIRLMTENAMTA